jgi:Glycerophosphoryl diester phosphodiesterase family
MLVKPVATAALIAISTLTAAASTSHRRHGEVRNEPSRLKSALQRCSEGPFFKTDFSIGHRGAPLQFPEHTRESYVAAARLGAGILECDVTFTEDLELVCRHSQCDLHTTTYASCMGLR